MGETTNDVLKAITKPRCTIVVPCYNEAARLPVQNFLTFLEHSNGIQFLFVNDGSSDGTLALLQALKNEARANVEVLNLPRNGGKGEAVRQGMLKAIEAGDSAYIGFWDADLATPLEAIPELLEVLMGNDRLQTVFGSRVRLLGRAVHRKAIRHYLGRIFASFASMLLRLPIYDTQCGAKIFRVTPELSAILDKPFISRWVFDVEILARSIALHNGDVHYHEHTIFEYPLLKWEDISGSKVHAGDFFTAFGDMLRIYWKYLR